MADPTTPADAQPEQAHAAEKPPAAPLTPEEAEAEAETAGSGDDEEYVSDPDDALLPEMRRREASDDEGSEEGRARIGSDRGDGDDGDGQGAAEVYEDEAYEDDDEEYYDDLAEEEVGEGFEEEYDGRAEPPKEVAGAQGEDGEKGDVEGEAAVEGDGEEKKEQEPFAVPTSGAFYMHDDRFQEESRGRRRRMFGGRKLWDAKDDQAWVHDRFEEMNLHEEHYEDKRMSRGRFRGRGGGGRTRGTGHGFARGGKYRGYNEDINNNHQNRPQKVVRGRGPRRYEAVAKNNRDVVGFQRKQPARSRESAASASAVRESGQTLNAQSEMAPPKKNVVNSSLNSASPPFYPSGASNPDFSVPAQRRDNMQAGGSNKVFPSSMKMDDNAKVQSGPAVRRDYGARDRFQHADGPVRQSPRSGGTSLNSSGFAASTVNHGQSSVVRTQGGNGIPSNNQSTSSLHQNPRAPTHQQSHTSVVHQKSGQVQTQSAMRIPTQQLNHRTGNPSTTQHLPVRSTESVENGLYPSSNKSNASSGAGKTNSQEAGRGSFMYGGAQVIGAAGAIGLAQGEQNFPGTPALLPVMQFGSQHPGGVGVPTVGMALPGYVAQQQMGMGNNEMTWLPLLTGAAGAFGGSYPPYIALDPAFYSRSSGQTSSSVPSRESIANKGASPPRNDIVNEEVDQRQNKPRRQILRDELQSVKHHAIFLSP
ncbi:glycine-rich protein-like [Oryza sativa Japonica Group]|uniref:Glycine-rich protein-like n=3 Tax=Oryza TaxID=4527 RepID=Q5ZC37_ORYSJ|nr:glycine-rich protein-like [Oryza sativa Japonica Group]BAD53167.1 glycine-rich protein-like [Oryza sativa Japonica Group]